MIVIIYNNRAGTVKEGDDISLIIVCVGIDNAVPIHHRRTALSVVEEVQRVRALLHTGDQLAVLDSDGEREHFVRGRAGRRQNGRVPAKL